MSKAIKTVLLCTLLATLVVSTARAGDAHETIAQWNPVKNRYVTREYFVHTPPSYDGISPVPLVLVFHGWGGNAEDMIDLALFEDMADLEGFISVHVQGYNFFSFNPLTWYRAWNIGGGRGENTAPVMHELDDVGLVMDIIDELVEHYNVDDTRIYAHGYSNGGMFVNRLAIEVADVFAAVSTKAGPTPITDLTIPVDRGIPVASFQATDDMVIPYNGGGGILFLEDPIISAQENVEYWAARNNCNPDPYDAGDFSYYYFCDDDAMVVLYPISGGGGLGHEYYHQNDQGVDITELSWLWFELFSL